MTRPHLYTFDRHSCLFVSLKYEQQINNIDTFRRTKLYDDEKQPVHFSLLRILVEPIFQQGEKVKKFYGKWKLGNAVKRPHVARYKSLHRIYLIFIFQFPYFKIHACVYFFKYATFGSTVSIRNV